MVGAAAGYLALWSVFWLFKLTTGKEGMGYGDFKLLAAIGAWLGWQDPAATIMLSSLVGAVVGVALIVLRKHGRESPSPSALTWPPPGLWPSTGASPSRRPTWACSDGARPGTAQAYDLKQRRLPHLIGSGSATFYWFLSIYDYYMYSGDKDFVTQLYPRMQSMMDYVLGRTNANGMVEGMTGDWVFVDWADGYLDKKGELSFEQVLFCKSLETMALCAGLAGNTADKTKYEKLASALRSKLEPAFWNEQKQAMVHNRVQGKQ